MFFIRKVLNGASSGNLRFWILIRVQDLPKKSNLRRRQYLSNLAYKSKLPGNWNQYNSKNTLSSLTHTLYPNLILYTLNILKIRLCDRHFYLSVLTDFKLCKIQGPQQDRRSSGAKKVLDALEQKQMQICILPQKQISKKTSLAKYNFINWIFSLSSLRL